MCVICVLAPGYTLPFEMLSKACHNNPHGYGIVIKRKEGLDIRKALPEGGNDPEEIYKILKENEDSERFLHVRWKTQGDVSEENVQPFEVFDRVLKIGNKKFRRHMAFMHNGTLSSYNPPYQHGVQTTGRAVPSDSLRFAREVLIPYLPKMLGDNGIGDISDPTIQILLDKYWSAASYNRGIIIANDLEPMLFNKASWEEIETSEVIDGVEVTGKFLASNNDYFETLKRGTLFDKLEAEKKRKEEEDKAKRSSFSQGPKIEGVSSPKFYEQYHFSESISNLLEDYDMYRAEGYLALANLTYHEWFKMVGEAKPDDVASLFLYLTDYLKQAHNQLDELKTEEQKAA